MLRSHHLYAVAHIIYIYICTLIAQLRQTWWWPLFMCMLWRFNLLDKWSWPLLVFCVGIIRVCGVWQDHIEAPSTDHTELQLSDEVDWKYFNWYSLHYAGNYLTCLLSFTSGKHLIHVQTTLLGIICEYLTSCYVYSMWLLVVFAFTLFSWFYIFY
jgi:hypothetical protein